MALTDSTLPSTPSVAAAPAPPRTWPAVLVLLFLPGITAEMLTGSTPVLVYLTNPLSLIANTLIYGCGALLIREVTRRRGLGWPSVMLLGAAYGIFEEGLVVNTWANPWLPQVCVVTKGVAAGICDYGRVGGISLAWAVSLTAFHALISITIPILLVELLFPSRAARPWLGRKAIVACVLSEALVLAGGLLLNVASYRQHGQAGPLLAPYLVEVALMVGLITLALRRARPAPPSPPIWSLTATASPATPRIRARTAPRLWSLRLLALLALAVNTLLPTLFKGLRAPFQIELAVNVVLLALAIWRVRAWSRRANWTDRQRLALASGALGFFLVLWDPLLEILGAAGGKPTRGTLLVALAYLVLLVVLARQPLHQSPSEAVELRDAAATSPSTAW